MKYIPLLFILMLGIACAPTGQGQKTASITTHVLPAFLRAKMFDNSSANSTHPVTVNLSLSNFYRGNYPKATIVADYNSIFYPIFWLAADLGGELENKLPKKIVDELRNRNLFNKNKVEIKWVVQLREFLGGNQNGPVKNISYLKAHTWADPDAPNKFPGARVNAFFDYGIFDADVDISDEVKLDQMNKFLIFTHDGMLSPQTAAIHFPNDTNQSISFFSLVIGKPFKETEERAIVTLHWLLGGESRDNNSDAYHFGKTLFEPSQRRPGFFVWYKLKNEYVDQPVEKFITDLEKTPFKQSLSMQKLKSLIE